MATNKRYLSKSKLMTFNESPRKLWDSVHNPDGLPEVDSFDEVLMKGGSEVDELFARLHANGADCRDRTEENHDQVEITKEWMAASAAGNPITLLQPAFLWDELYSRGDVMRPEEDGSYTLLECKAVSKPDKDDILDAAIQTYIGRKAGANIKEVKIAHLNPDFRRVGDCNPGEDVGAGLDLTALFMETDVTEAVEALQSVIPDMVTKAREVMSMDAAPEVDVWNGEMMKLSKSDLKHYAPHRMLPDSPIHIPYIKRPDAITEIKEILEDRKGKGDRNPHVGVGDLTEKGRNHRAAVFVECMRDKTMYVDSYALGANLDSLKFPVVFFDFETVMDAIPRYDGVGPNTQIPFQVCAIRINGPGAEPEVFEFLAGHKDADPRIGVFETLARAVKGAETVVAFNASFELGCIRGAAILHEKMGTGKEFGSIPDRTVDIGKPFMDYKVFSCDQGGKGAGLKHVTAAIFEGEAYGEITGGSDASMRYMQARAGEKTDEEILLDRKAGLEYCRQDVQGMIELAGAMEILSGVQPEEQRFVRYMKAEIKGTLPPIVGTLKGEVLEPKSRPKAKTKLGPVKDGLA